MEKSYRVIWEIDVDAVDAKDAAQQAYDSIVNGTAPVFEVHQWVEPPMTEVIPVVLVDVKDLSWEGPVPNKRVISEQYMGPDII
jgi:hypothetical protein